MAEEKQETETTVSLIENPVELFNEFRRLFGILDKSPLSIDILRVALNLHFININESYEDANKVLLRTIPEEYGVKIKSEEDFIFRINKPRKSEKISTVRMNYITQWSVDRIEVSKIAISPSGVGIGIPPSPLSTCIASRVLIDNNNTPKDILPSNAQAELLREALEETSEVNKKIGLNIEGL